MAYKLAYASSVQKDLDRLDPVITRRILKKLTWISEQDDPMRFATHLTDSKMGDYRFRVGDYRAVGSVDKKKEIVYINVVGHRGEIYR